MNDEKRVGKIVKIKENGPELPGLISCAGLKVPRSSAPGESEIVQQAPGGTKIVRKNYNTKSEQKCQENYLIDYFVD